MPTEIAPGLLSWASDIQPNTVQQAARTARSAVVTGHVALMPDAHGGIGSTIGSVIPTTDAIIPAAVGVDLGCGMVATETDLTASDLPADLNALLSVIGQRIPAGLGKGHEHASIADNTLALLGKPATDLTTKQSDTAALQFATLGSGNHFVELCLDERDVVWTVLHSGSRGIGNQLASAHIKVARSVATAYHIPLEDPDLAYLVQGTPEFDAYIKDMLWAQHYAMLSRSQMADKLNKSLFEAVGKGKQAKRINCFAGETRVITSTGTYPISELAGTNPELLTTNGQWVKAPVHAFGRQRLMRVLLSRNGTKKEIFATAEHGWLLRTHSRSGVRYWGAHRSEHVITTELQKGDRLQWSFTSKSNDPVVDQEGAARGFVFGDGSCPKGHYKSHANFCGDKDTALMPLFEGRGNSPRVYTAFTRITGLPSNWKNIPNLNHDVSYLYGWLAGYFAADGDVDKTGRPTLACASKEILEQVRTICNLIGVGTYGIRMRMRSGFGRPPTALYLMGLMRGDLDPEFFLIPAHRAHYENGRNAMERRGWTVVSVEETDRIEEVYCAVVDDTHAFTLEDHILTQNCHHNFAQRENHKGRNLWITRKGAIKAAVGDEGVIPGSMGTRSYIVSGLGNTASYTSCAHGAGRRMSRTQAKRELSVESLHTAMKGQTWNSDRAESLLDEHPDSYKPIDQVMEDQKDLVTVQHVLHQVLNYKG